MRRYKDICCKIVILWSIKVMYQKSLCFIMCDFRNVFIDNNILKVSWLCEVFILCIHCDINTQCLKSHYKHWNTNKVPECVKKNVTLRREDAFINMCTEKYHIFVWCYISFMLTYWTLGGKRWNEWMNIPLFY